VLTLMLSLIISVFAVGRYGLAKPSEEASIKLNINVNTDEGVDVGPIHKSFLIHKEDGNWKSTQALARSLPIEARLLEAHDYGKVCSDCTSEFSSDIIQCVRKLKNDEEYRNCFQEILDEDKKREGKKKEKCATCICKILNINMRVNLDEYPTLKEMFCFSANEYEDCRVKETQDSEQFPPCREDLTCESIDGGKDYGICVEEKCVDTNKDEVDQTGMDCEGYAFWNLCSQSDKGKDANFEAKKMCCACGGGSVPREPEIHPIPELGVIGIGVPSTPKLNCIGRCGGACPPCE